MSPEFHFLDRFALGQIRHSKAASEELNKYHWQYYSELAYQRSKIIQELRTSLLQAAIGPFQFERWQRTTRLRWALQPLSCKGSVLDVGGRFNYGQIGPNFAPFPALYIAKDKKTSLCELVGQNVENSGEMSPYDLALADQTSLAIVSVSGSLETVIDLTQPAKLQDFVDLIKGFKLSEHLRKAAKKLKVPPPTVVKTVDWLMKMLLDENWRGMPMQVDVPAPCQIFGELVASTGIQGIVYPSKFTDKECLAVFPETLRNSDSFVAMDDAPPSHETITRLDFKSISDLC